MRKIKLGKKFKFKGDKEIFYYCCQSGIELFEKRVFAKELKSRFDKNPETKLNDLLTEINGEIKQAESEGDL